MTAVLADTDWVMILLLGLTLMAGAIVQSLVGFGIAVVAAPFVVVFAPDLMPGAIPRHRRVAADPRTVPRARRGGLANP